MLSYSDVVLYLDKLNEIFKIGVGWIVFIVFLLLLVIFKPETIEHWWSKILKLFIWTGKKARKQQIEKEINANLLKSAREITKEIDEIIPYKLKVQWVGKQDRQTFLEGNNVVVCMDNKRNKTENIAYAINDFVHAALLPEERLNLDDEMHHASCLVMTRKLLFSAYNTDVSTYFMGMVKEEANKDEELKKLIDELITMDENGFFVQIMLREIQKRSLLVFGKLDNQEFIEETRNFVRFLYEIARREIGEESNLGFDGKYYKTKIVLVARYWTYRRSGTRGYVKAFNQAILEGKDSIYLMARDGKYKILNEVINEIIVEHPELKNKKMEFRGLRKDNVKFKGLIYHLEK